MSSVNPELTAEVLAELRERLENRRTELRGELAGEDEQRSLGADADSVGDVADSSVDLQEVDIEAVTGADLRTELADVERALAKMRQGTYGICEEGGEPIPLARLRALPTARYDARHQAEIEARQQPR